MDNETLRKVQLAQLEIAKEFRRVCDENEIPYFIDWGSMLGAIRHKGFIPWDDDMDFGMLRADYERFLKIAPEKLGEEYFLQTWDTDPSFPNAFAKIRKKGTVYIEATMEKSNAHNELFIDVFPYDVYPNTPKQAKKAGRTIYCCANTLFIQNKVRPWMHHSSRLKRFLAKCKYIPFWVLSKLIRRDTLKKKYTEAMTCANSEKPVYYYGNVKAISCGEHPIPAECYDSMIEMPFENENFKVPVGYDRILTCLYGDYMTPPPEDKRGNRHGIIELKL